MKLSSSGKDDWATPQYLFDQLHDIFNFEVDAACTTGNRKTRYGYFYDQGFDGLTKKWTERTWCNPPFSKKNDWIIKAHNEVTLGTCPLCVMILPLNSISTEIFHTYIQDKFKFDILKGRVSFLRDGEPVNGNNTGTVVVYFMKKPITVAGAK